MLRRDAETQISAAVSMGRQPQACPELRYKILDWRQHVANWPASRRGRQLSVDNERDPIRRASMEQSLAVATVFHCAQRHVLAAMEATCGR